MRLGPAAPPWASLLARLAGDGVPVDVDGRPLVARLVPLASASKARRVVRLAPAPGGGGPAAVAVDFKYFHTCDCVAFRADGFDCAHLRALLAAGILEPAEFIGDEFAPPGLIGGAR